MKRKKKMQPPFVFSPEMIHVTQEAITIFAQMLAGAEGQPAKVAFAEETTRQVKNKLAAMATSVGTRCLTSFDYNEKLIIATAIQLYLLTPPDAPVSSRSEGEMRRCQRILQFALDPGQDDEQANSIHAEIRHQ